MSRERFSADQVHGGDVLSALEQLRRARHAVGVGRRLLVTLAAALAAFVCTRLLLAAASAAEPTSAGTDAPVTAPLLVALLVTAGVWWRSRSTPPDLARTALWVEERQAALRDAHPDFALTTAVELLEQRRDVPLSLAHAAVSTLRTSPTLGALNTERRLSWQWPLLFVVMCAVLVWRDLQRPAAGTASAEQSASRASTESAGRAPAVAPLGAWLVRVQPPPYVAQAARSFGDVTTVSALSGSQIMVSGDGQQPTVEAGVADSVANAAAVVRATANGWLATMRASAGVQTLRVSRGGRTRLLIVEGRADSVPRVSLDAPARDSVFREPAGVLPLAATAHDDLGLSRAHFELIVTSGEGERFTVRTVLLGAQRWSAAAGHREARLRGQLDLAALGLQAGDVVHLRAVARDAHPAADREFGSSETRAFRIARPAEYDSVAVEPAPPPEVDKSLLSQRMLLLLTEKLDRAQPRMPRAEVVRESQKIARDQARLRLAVGDVVFQRLSGESAAEHAHTAGDGHDHGVDLQGGKLAMSTSSTTGMLEEGNDSPVIAINQPLLEAYNAMWDAGRALEQGDPHGAIPPMKRALEAIEKSRAASRLYLRGRPPQVIVDIAKVRLTGKDTGQVTVRSARAPLPTPMAARDARLVRAARLVATAPEAARDSVALLRAESLVDAPSFAAALGTVLTAFERGGDATALFVQARRVLGNVSRTRATPWSRGVTP
ncbi:hypothetical protein [Gemmatimonas sp.]